jgi:hypothetical protein
MQEAGLCGHGSISVDEPRLIQAERKAIRRSRFIL